MGRTFTNLHMRNSSATDSGTYCGGSHSPIWHVDLRSVPNGQIDKLKADPHPCKRCIKAYEARAAAGVAQQEKLIKKAKRVEKKAEKAKKAEKKAESTKPVAKKPAAKTTTKTAKKKAVAKVVKKVAKKATKTTVKTKPAKKATVAKAATKKIEKVEPKKVVAPKKVVEKKTAAPKAASKVANGKSNGRSKPSKPKAKSPIPFQPLQPAEESNTPVEVEVPDEFLGEDDRGEDPLLG